VKVVVLTTSYPRDDQDVAGSFVAAAVRGVRERGVDVEVVAPASFPSFGLAYGAGIAQNLRAAPWKLALVPPFMAAYAGAARTAARDADLVHAHWIPSGLAALATGKPFLLQVWGTDVELARRAPGFVRPLVRRAEAVIAASTYLADQASSLGARAVHVVQPGVAPPAGPGEPAVPPHVLYAGRLSEEKGILEFVEATAGLPRVIVGDGPLRDRVPETVGFVAPAAIGEYYKRASAVCVPSRREGYGMAAREAMAYGRPVVATRVGGLADLEGEGVVLVEPGDTAALRSVLERLLADPVERQRRGKAARAAAALNTPTKAAADLYAVYESTLAP
jgi:glycosyltransferase involved in cell wall biosynthesis